MYVQSNNVACSCDHCYCGKAKSITHFECASIALVIKHATCMHHVILRSVASPVLQDFSTLSHTQPDLRGGREKFIEHKMCEILITNK